MVVSEASDEALDRWSLSGGVVVREVQPGSPAADAGVLPGDIITLVGSKPVKSLEAFEKAVAGLEDGATVPLRLMRRGSPLFIGLRLSD